MTKDMKKLGYDTGASNTQPYSSDWSADWWIQMPQKHVNQVFPCGSNIITKFCFYKMHSLPIFMDINNASTVSNKVYFLLCDFNRYFDFSFYKHL